MIKIQALLNAPPSPKTLPPFSSISAPPTPVSTNQTPSTPSTPSPPTPSPDTSSRTRPKMAKDVAIFKKGSPNGTVNFPPFEPANVLDSLHNGDRHSADQHNSVNAADARELERQLRRFEVFPSGGQDGLISDFARTIPYKARVRDTYHADTGREAFTVFQYTFVLPGKPDAAPWTVIWDYETGLVRTTPFFRALGLSKTEPKKAISYNRGLEGLCYNITGGSIVAQGYWMPYHCARAVCATFCYNIRWALTPIFGPTFVNDCVRPGHEDFEQYKIPESVLRDAQFCAALMKSDSGVPTTPMPPKSTSSMKRTLRKAATSAANFAATPSQKSPTEERPKRPALKTDVPLASPFATPNTTSAGTPGTRRRNSSVSVSPKTKVSPAAFINTGFTPINLKYNTSSCLLEDTTSPSAQSGLNSGSSSTQNGKKRAREPDSEDAMLEQHAAQKIHSREYNAACALLQLAREDSALRVKREAEEERQRSRARAAMERCGAEFDEPPVRECTMGGDML